MRRVAGLLALSAALAAPLAHATEQALRPWSGKQTPALALRDLDGKPVDLAPYIGHKPALFEFWATWCENCAALEPRMRTAFERHGRQVDFVTVAVAVAQTKASVQRHVAQHPLPASRVLWDTNGNAVRAFDTPATSYIVVLDRQGRVAYTGIGPDQDLEAALARVTR